MQRNAAMRGPQENFLSVSAILYEAKKCVNKACFSFLGQNWLFAHGIASHGNIEDKTHKDKVYDCGRATIAYEGQGDAHNGHEAYHHAHVDGDFQDEIEEDTNTQKASEAILCLNDRSQDGEKEDGKERHKGKAAHKAPFFAEDCHGKVRVPFWQKAQPRVQPEKKMAPVPKSPAMAGSSQR